MVLVVSVWFGELSDGVGGFRAAQRKTFRFRNSLFGDLPQTSKFGAHFWGVSGGFQVVLVVSVWLLWVFGPVNRESVGLEYRLWQRSQTSKLAA